MQRRDSGSPSKPVGASRRPDSGSSHRVLLVGILAPAAWLLAACGSGPDLISTVALPTEQATDYAEGVDDSPDTGRGFTALDLTPAQKQYLDALGAEGVNPSSELRALSIGSYVCQAQAAGQSDQSVWDSVAPMVRSDVADSRVASRAAAAPDPSAAVDQYIRIATQRLC